MRDIVVTAILLGLLPRCFTRPHVGVLTWSWVGYMNPHRLGWGFAVTLPAAQMVALPTLLGLLVSREPKKVPLTPVTVLLGLFVLWGAVTSPFALNPEEVWEAWQQLFKMMLMVFVTLMVMRSRERLHALVWVVVISIGFFGVKTGLFTLRGGGQGMVGPPGSFIDGNTTLGLAMTMTLPLMWYLRLQAGKKWIRVSLLVAMGLTAIAILGSHSRGALLAIGAAGVFLWWKSRHKAMLAVLVLLMLPVAFLMMPQEWRDRMATISDYQNDASSMGRINAWGFAINAIKERPIVGVGYQGFTPEAFLHWAPDPTDWHDAHSIYFEVLGEQGIPGLLIFLAILGLTWRNAGVVLRLARGDPDWLWAADLAAMIQVSLIAYMVGGTFLGLAYWDMPYTLAAILVLLRKLCEEAKLPRVAAGQGRRTLPARQGPAVPALHNRA
ncbi:MAG: putative O-glycosylation ligase, exosortase A system-associated [Pseudomonadota bacterium]